MVISYLFHIIFCFMSDLLEFQQFFGCYCTSTQPIFTIDILVMALNFIYIFAVMAALGGYIIRYIYWLMPEKLLTNVASLWKYEIDKVLKAIRLFDQVKKLKKYADNHCSVFYWNLTDSLCSMLSGCEPALRLIYQWLNLNKLVLVTGVIWGFILLSVWSNF